MGEKDKFHCGLGGKRVQLIISDNIILCVKAHQLRTPLIFAYATLLMARIRPPQTPKSKLKMALFQSSPPFLLSSIHQQEAEECDDNERVLGHLIELMVHNEWRHFPLVLLFSMDERIHIVEYLRKTFKADSKLRPRT